MDNYRTFKVKAYDLTYDDQLDGVWVKDEMFLSRAFILHSLTVLAEYDNETTPKGH